MRFKERPACRGTEWLTANQCTLGFLVIVAMLVLAGCYNAGPLGSEPASGGPTSSQAVSSASAAQSAGAVVPSWVVDEPDGMAFGAGSIWVAGHHSTRVTQIDPGTNAVVTEIQGIHDEAIAVVVAFDSVWVPAANGAMVRLDPASGATQATFDDHYLDADAGFGSLWAVTTTHRLDRIDPATNKVVASVSLGTGTAELTDTLAIGTTAVWVAVADASTILAVDPAILDILMTSADLGTPPSLAWGPLGVWANLGNGDLLKVDEQAMARGTSFAAETGAGYAALAVGQNDLWLAGPDGKLLRLDPATGGVRGTWGLPHAPQGLLVAVGSIWVDYYQHRSSVARLTPEPPAT